ncbi:MAG: sulfite oxidase [Gemmataceae bacterium]|nr:sulfite oxidase [Gemmataceae bacterium]
MPHLSRRDLLRAVSLAPAATLLAGRSAAEPPAAIPNASFNGMIVRQHRPENLEMPFGSLADWKVPTERFYVRSHFAVPAVDPKTFKLVVEGHVENRLELSLDEVKKLAPVTTPLTLECAGNGRVFLVPAARGLQWGHGGVGTADWTGVPLAAVLDRAKPRPGAAEVVLVGADRGAVADPATPGPIHFSFSQTYAKARRPEALLAWGMNGEDLTPAHGFPLRAVVGGWYGMAAVKWLTRIVVVDRPYGGYFQTLDYAYFVRPIGEEPELVPVREIQPKAVIARPGLNEVVPAGKAYTIFGAAWAGENKVARVELSTDGGKTWAAAHLDGTQKPFCWVLWRYEWTAPVEKGPVNLLARCTDEKGTTQPAERDPDRRSYMINHLIPVSVLVR